MNELSDSEILHGWYQFASAQPGSVETLLKLLRARQGKSLKDQQTEFGASLEQFSRLRAMRLPRSASFTSDALRMAEACQLSEPMRFVHALVLARSFSLGSGQPEAQAGYKAALDDIGDLDAEPSDDAP